jgi:MFS transporter, AAHS family, 4-hydroxybenzoate transporter
LNAKTELIDIARVIDDGPWNPFQKGLMALAALAFVVDGLANQALGVAVPALVQDWGVPRERFSDVAAAGLLGVILGTAVGGWCGDRRGRREVLIASVLVFGGASVASALCTGPMGLLVLRAIAGVGIGGAIPSGAALISEFTPARRRSLAICLGMVFIPVGSLLSGIIAALVLPGLGWRGLFAITGALPLLLSGVLVRFLPESPRFLVREPKRATELRAVIARCGYRCSARAAFVETAQEPSSGRYRALFENGLRMDTVSLWVGFFFNMLGSYTMFSWAPTLLTSEGYSVRAASLGIAAFNVGGVLGGVAGGWLIGAFGSRQPLPGFAAAGLVSAVTLALVPAGSAAAPIIVPIALVFEGMCVAALAAGLYTLAAHLYPPPVRSTGVGTAVAVGRVGAVISSYTGVSTLRAGGGAYFLLIAAELCIAFLALLLVRNHIPGASREMSGVGAS